MDESTRQYKADLRAYIKYDLGRKMKFLPKGFELWSDKTNTVCQKVLANVHFPPDTTDEEKMDIWNGVLAPNLTPLFTEYKNKIHQRMFHFVSSLYNI